MHALLAGEVSEWPGLDMVAAHHDGTRLPATANAHPAMPLNLVQSGVGAGLRVSCCMGVCFKWCCKSAQDSRRSSAPGPDCATISMLRRSSPCELRTDAHRTALCLATPCMRVRAAFVRGEAEPAGKENDAAWLLRFYNTFLADANEYDVTQAALNSLATLRGNFAFVLYDAGGAHVLKDSCIARDQPVAHDRQAPSGSTAVGPASACRRP